TKELAIRFPSQSEETCVSRSQWFTLQLVPPLLLPSKRPLRLPHRTRRQQARASQRRSPPFLKKREGSSPKAQRGRWKPRAEVRRQKIPRGVRLKACKYSRR